VTYYLRTNPEEKQMKTSGHQSISVNRVLAVVDWDADPERSVRAIRATAGVGRTVFGLIVPARLHRLDWVGDPIASVPCAERQLNAVAELADRDGIDLARLGVGEPEALTAIRDALLRWPADEVLLARARHLAPRPFNLGSRVRRATRLPVRRVDARPTHGHVHCDAGPASGRVRVGAR
jgi:hypothetical protein